MSPSPIEIFFHNFKYRRDVTECRWITRTYCMVFLARLEWLTRNGFFTHRTELHVLKGKILLALKQGPKGLF